MKNKLFVSNIDFEVTTDQLREMFELIGPCVSVVIATERETKRSKGFAFVELEKEEDAQRVIEELNNKVINGRPMKVVFDRGKGDGGPQGEGGRPERGPREHLPPIQRLQIFRRRKKLDPFLQDPTRTVNYRDTQILGRFVSERGRILSRRLTGLSAYNQRKVSKAIKRAQSMGLLPYSRG